MIHLLDNKKEKLWVNIWDDYYDDGHVPKGKIQETYIYVEQINDLVGDINLPDDIQKSCLEMLLNYINEKVSLSGVTMWLEWQDWKKKYPSLVGTEHEQYAFSRWEIRVQNLTHSAREKLVEKLEQANLSFDNFSLVIISES